MLNQLLSYFNSNKLEVLSYNNMDKILESEQFENSDKQLKSSGTL